MYLPFTPMTRYLNQWHSFDSTWKYLIFYSEFKTPVICAPLIHSSHIKNADFISVFPYFGHMCEWAAGQPIRLTRLEDKDCLLETCKAMAWSHLCWFYMTLCAFITDSKRKHLNVISQAGKQPHQVVKQTWEWINNFYFWGAFFLFTVSCRFPEAETCLRNGRRDRGMYILFRSSAAWIWWNALMPPWSSRWKLHSAPRSWISRPLSKSLHWILSDVPVVCVFTPWPIWKNKHN